MKEKLDHKNLPDKNGYFGEYGGQLIPEYLIKIMNEINDAYLEIKDSTGFRQKVMPQFDGKYKTNGLKETIKVFKVDGAYFLGCETPFGKWNEEILSIADSALVLKNKRDQIYTYKRFKPFSLK